MIVFALFSLPLFFVIIDDTVTLKKVTQYFSGIIVSSIICLIFWALSTFYQYNSDTVLNITIDEVIEVLLPLFILFLYIFICRLRDKRSIFTTDFLIGYLHWNMLFALLSDVRSSYSYQEIYIPFFYILAVFVLYNLDRVHFVKKDGLIKKIVVVLFPIYVFIVHILKNVSLVSVLVWLFLQLTVIIIIKKDLWSIKKRLFK